MNDENLTIQPLEQCRKDDFYAVHSKPCGSEWCYCTAWWVPTWENWGQRTAQDNIRVRENLFQENKFDGFLLYLRVRSSS